MPLGTLVGLILALWLYNSGLLNRDSEPPAEGDSGVYEIQPERSGPATSATQQAYLQRASGVLVEDRGVVYKVLDDDNQGSRHQRFLVRLSDDHTVLIAHNIDLADRVPLAEGDTVSFLGQFEWNEKGGLIHWTHHDPAKQRIGGYIEHSGLRYE